MIRWLKRKLLRHELKHLHGEIDSLRRQLDFCRNMDSFVESAALKVAGERIRELSLECDRLRAKVTELEARMEGMKVFA